ncbi:MAG TPA: ABC transporter ATP-binding protein [Gemmatimonadales bacterium]|nr:ABC transporter ATP-binding protein [Gemmatimonadales bacterium]
MTARPSAAWREVRSLLRRQRRPVAVALVLVAVSRVAAMGLPTASRYVVDEVIGRQRGDRLGLVALLACAAVSVEAVAGFAAAQIAGVSGQHAVAGLRQELQVRVLALPLRRLEESPTAVLAARVMADSDQVRYLVGNGVVQLIASVLTAGLALGLLFRIDVSLTLCVLALLGLVGLGVGRTFGRISRGFEGVIRRQAELTGRFGQVLGGIRVVKAFAAERHEASRFAKESHRLLRESVAVLRRVSLLGAGNALAAGSLGVLLLVLGGQLVAAGDMSLGSYVMYVWLSGFLVAPVLHVAASAGELGKAVAAAGRIAALRELPTEGEEDRTRPRIRQVVGSVELEDVSYQYGSGRLALHGVSFRAPAGSTTALVGTNGSGKSTLCRLLLGYDRPTSGRILIDGHDLSALDRRTYRSRLGVVLQDDLLFDGTVAENIRYGRQRASLGEMQAAARLAHCEEFVNRLPEGYSTLVGERGMRLSAGQRQRVAIARALLADPRILVLDEATSNLDAESEELIRNALRLLCGSRTTFVVAHRLAAIRSADQILVLHDGAIARRGTYAELVTPHACRLHRGRIASFPEGTGRGH